ncbi:MAG: glycosyltransferase family 39 protein [Chloroflexota bacterium]
MDRLTRYHALALMVLCLLAAAALRFPDLTTLPPGVHYDEAANGILAGDIGLRGDRPIFISSYTGKEPLFFYLSGGMMRVLGESVFALRLTAAFAGILTVAATYWLGREMLADRRMALLAAALLAVSFWHVLFSRLGFRAITEPLLQALTVAALFRGLRSNRWVWFVVAGFFWG